MPINVIISKDEVKTSGGTTPSPSNPNGYSSSSAKTTATSLYAMAIAKAGIDMAKNELNYMMSQYGNFTGDYYNQKRMTNAVSNVKSVVGVAAGVGQLGIGIATGNPLAAVGGVVTLATTGVNAVNNAITYNANFTKANVIANFNSAQIGRILTDGGR